jgi:hypothetical protein
MVMMRLLVRICRQERTGTSILIVCVLGIISLTVSSCSDKIYEKVGDHHIEVIDTTLFGGNSGADDVYSTSDGMPAYKYESHQLRIRLEHEVLIVNGKRYAIPHKNDSIRIKGGHVWINGQAAKPEPESASSDSNSTGPK